jgi:hypothetical protein
MELFRTDSKDQRFVIVKCDMIHGYLGYKIVAIKKKLMVIASLIKEMLGKRTYVIDSTHCINKAILSSEKMISTISVKNLLIVLTDKLK